MKNSLQENTIKDHIKKLGHKTLNEMHINKFDFLVPDMRQQNINTFLYFQYKNGLRTISLSNNTKWQSHFFTSVDKYPEGDLAESLLKKLTLPEKSGIYILPWETFKSTCLNKVSLDLMEMNMRSGILIINYNAENATHEMMTFYSHLYHEQFYAVISKKIDMLQSIYFKLHEKYHNFIKKSSTEFENKIFAVNKKLYHFETREEAKKTIFEFIEVFYNQQRRHSYLDYKTPADFESMQINC